MEVPPPIPLVEKEIEDTGYKIPASLNDTTSRICGVSIRGWVTLILVGTVCFMAAKTIKVEEPLYSLVSLAVGFYFGQKTK